MSGAGEFSGTITAGSYRVVRALGGDGRVHEARHERLAARFALKLLGDVDARAFQRGAQQAAALRHPGIVKVVDYGMDGRGAFIVMEWADGRSLTSMLGEGGPLAPDAVARIVDSVALGLQAAHRQGVGHGHLAPERLLVSGPGVAHQSNNDETPGAEHTKILGFGLGPAGALTPGMNITEVTPYTAPEQLAGDASPLADQYALAAIAYEMLTGEAPMSDALLRKPPRSLREYDPTINVIVDDVVQRALSFDPKERWVDVYTFAARLREAVDSEGALEEKTRLAPLPLTVRPSATPTPIELPPVIASIDIDLRTPAPKRRELPFRELPRQELPRPKLPVQGEISMNPPSRQQPFAPSQLPGSLPSPRQTRSPTGSHYGIRPTPTFSFTDDPAPGPLYKPRGGRRRSGGVFGLFVLVLAAGAGGYLSVQTRVWQHAEPLLARAKDLVRSLRTLAPGASPEPTPAAAPAAANLNAPAPGAPASAGATTPPAAMAPAATASAGPALRPEVVQIAPATPAKTASRTSAHHVSHAYHPRAHAERAPKGRASKALSDEAATEEALLAPPSGGR